ncbi:MAG: hypothetical protein OWT28_06245 [Firmicutes bacterium]|nr:hypothetical protein [Bacillota bacterium]
MTKRYSIEDVAQMLQADVNKVRLTVSSLHRAQELSAETFPFAERAWRIAPSDVIKIQLRMEQGDTLGTTGETGESPNGSPAARVVRRTVRKEADQS